MVKHVSGTLNVPAPISKPITSAVIMAGDYLSSLIPSLYIGSSGAVSSLMGCSAVISLFKLINEIDYLRRNKHTSYIQSIRNIAFSGAGVLQSIYFILNELYLSDPKALISKESTYFSKFIKIYEVSGTNHVGHVQGFFFGAIYGLAFGVVAPYLWRRRSKVIR
jgi:membrane associated rhomboid family serine protease